MVVSSRIKATQMFFVYRHGLENAKKLTIGFTVTFNCALQQREDRLASSQCRGWGAVDNWQCTKQRPRHFHTSEAPAPDQQQHSHDNCWSAKWWQSGHSDQPQQECEWYDDNKWRGTNAKYGPACQMSQQGRRPGLPQPTVVQLVQKAWRRNHTILSHHRHI